MQELQNHQDMINHKSEILTAKMGKKPSEKNTECLEYKEQNENQQTITTIGRNKQTHQNH